MDDRGVNQRTYKELKKEIIEDTAINVGYYWEVINEIPNDVLINTIKELSTNGWITKDTSGQELRNMLVTESVKNMSYQEFKNIANYFFSFVPDDKAQYLRTEVLEVTREDYEYLTGHTERAFGLERELEQIRTGQNSLDNKINQVELISVSSDNEVVGIDLVKEELLVLMSPRNVFIDEEIIQDDNLISNYRSRDSEEKQVLDYLTERYKDIDLMKKEYVLNSDTYQGLIDVDYYDIDEISFDEIPLSSFSTHREYFEWATQFNSFNERYSSYQDYIFERFNDIYSKGYEPDYSKNILADKKREIDEVLEKNDKTLIIKEVTGHSQGDGWNISYLADKTQDVQAVEIYLDNFVGAWYKGTLTELQVISFDAYENGKYNGGVEEVNYIDTDILSLKSDKLDKIKEIYPEYSKFKTKIEIQTLEQTQKATQAVKGEKRL